MKLFLSWSGAKSHAAAKVFHDWLPDVVQQIEPWLSSESIEKGELWLGSIKDALQATNGTGVFFLTPEALTSSWLLYEAGGIAAAVGSARVCTVCVGMAPRDVTTPLSFFQTTQINADDILRLLKTINSRCTPPIEIGRLEKNFRKYWPELETALAPVLKMPDTVVPEKKSTDPVTNALEKVLDGQHRIEARIGALEQRQAISVVGIPPVWAKMGAGKSTTYEEFLDKQNLADAATLQGAVNRLQAIGLNPDASFIDASKNALRDDPKKKK